MWCFLFYEEGIIGVDMQIFRLIIGAGYRHGIKPLLFRRSPDDVHEGLVKFAVFLQKVPGVTRFGYWLLSHKKTDRLQQEVCSIQLNNPIGIAAGFDKNIELQPTLRMVGCGFETGGSITRKPRAGNPRPWFYRLPKTKSLVVHAGLANHGIDKITTNIQQSKATQAQMPLIISVAVAACDDKCTTSQAIQEACETLQIIQQKQLAQAVEINISCPNAQDGQPFTQTENLQALLSAVDSLKLALPIFIKMPNKATWEAFEPILDIVASHAVQGVTVANLVKDREHVELSDELPNDIKGGLSGKPTFDRSNLLIRETYKKYGDKLVIIGVGGVFSAEDAYEKIASGASLVALITGMIFEGPQLIGDINRQLAKRLEADGVANIKELVGAASLE